MSSQPTHTNTTNVAGSSQPQAAAMLAANTTAVNLNNQAGQASERGDYARAISLHNQALPLKIAGFGPDSVQAAITLNALGECHLKAGNLDEAASFLQRALHVRDNKAFGGLGLGPRNDAAATRDNYAQVLEARGGEANFKEAREIRRKGAELGETMCGNYNCISPGGAMLRTDQLKACGACKSVFYCSAQCQKADWKARHKPLCKAFTDSQPAGK